jgi:sporulation protein YlmC with PRC-barrel domain
MIRLSDLRDKMIRTPEGETLGCVHEVHCEKGRIVALMCGSGSFIESWTAKTQGRRIPWECVLRVEAKQVVVAPDPPKRKAVPKVPKKASASRSRQGTRRPSAPRSKR